ncbi:hypothetical protein [Modestobacter sp. SYSU DS0290]
MNREQAAIATHDAAELLVYAGLTGDRDLEQRAHELLDDAARGDGTLPGPAEREALVAVDPVSAATLGWLSYPELVRAVIGEPDRYLNPDEADAVRSNAANLRLVVAARLEGRPFSEVLHEGSQRDYALAARGNADDVRRLWQMLKAEGLIDEEPPASDGER